MCVCVRGSIGNRHAGWGECGCIKAIPQQKPNHQQQSASALITPFGLPIIKAKEKKKIERENERKKAVPKPLVSLCALWWSQLQTSKCVREGKNKKQETKILCAMIASYADKRVGYNTLWETKCGGVGGERNFSDVWSDGKAGLLANNSRRALTSEETFSWSELF